MFLEKSKPGIEKWWHYLLTVIIVIVGVVIGQVPFLVAVSVSAAQQGLSEEDINEMSANMDFSRIGIDENAGVFFMLLAFVAGLATLWLCVAKIHKKRFVRLIAPAESINWKKIIFSFGLWMGIAILTELIFYLLNPGNYSFHFQADKFFVLLLIAVFIFPLQTSFEELFFRGYMLHGIAQISKYRWIPLAVTSVAFGTLHIMNPEVAAFGTGITMVYYIGVGLFLGFLTLMDDSLELALGIHAATNIYGALFVTFDESALQTAAIFKMADVDMVGMLIAFFLGATLFTLLVSKKYGWHDWTRWHGRIEGPPAAGDTGNELPQEIA